MEGLHPQQALQKHPRRAGVAAHHLQPCDPQPLVSDVAAAPANVPFDHVEVPPNCAGIHADILRGIAQEHHAPKLVPHS
jgi:hypothetical protein